MRKTNAARTVLSLIFSTLLTIGTLALTAPNLSYADEASDVMSQVKSIRASIDSAKSEYVSATQVTEQIEAQIAELSERTSTLEESIADKRAQLSEILVREYKSPMSSSFIQAISEAESFDEALRQFEYASVVAEDRAKTVREINALTAQAREAIEELEMKKSQSEFAKIDASAAQESFNAKLEEMRPQIQEIRSSYLETAASSSGSAQLDAALSYLESIDGATEAQIALLRSAYRTSYAGGDRCEAWAEAVYRNAGYSIGRYAGAAQAAQALTVSTDLDSIPVGVLVFGSGSGSYMGQRYGHVGICVASGTGNGDALIIDNEGSRTKTAVPLSEWSEWQVSTSWVSGKQGAFAWGYPDSVSLSPAVL